MRATPAQFMALFPEFRAPSWSRWRSILETITPATRELYVAAGRGSGKSRVCAVLAAWASAREYRRAPGEEVYVGVFGPSMSQAKLTHRYIGGLLDARPELRALVVSESSGRIELRGGVVVEVISASVAAPRGRSYALAIIEEAAFLPTEGSANPDVELLRAVRPALARVPGSLLAVVSSPYARRGILWSAAKRAAERADEGGDDGRVVFVQENTLALNPTFDAAAIETAYAEDPVGAATEYGAEFRSDVETFISIEAVEAVTVPDRIELPPAPNVSYVGFLDFAGGSGKDSATLAIAHAIDRDSRRVAVLDLVREVKPPFSPERVCADFANELKRYQITEATADRYAADFATEAMRRQGVELKAADKAKGDIYKELLPALNSGTVELLDVPRLHAQLTGLERKTARGGRDSIDHGPGQHDDMINAAAGALVEAAREPASTKLTWGTPGWRVGGWGSTRRGLPGQRRGERLIGDPFAQDNRFR